MSVPAPTTSTAAADTVPVPRGARTDRTAIRPVQIPVPGEELRASVRPLR